MGVVLYHYFLGKFPGGYLGVDVFFVISGFLITRTLLSASQNSSPKQYFSSFYANRIRRIFPALIITFVLLYISILFISDLALQISSIKSIFFSSVFLQNFALAEQVGYFDSAAISKPLLHLWSLSVEEQFYIFFPVLVYFFQRKRVALRAILPIIVFLLFLLSFCSYLFISTENRDAAFYLSWFRFWEISLGSLLALRIRSINIPKKAQLPLLRLSWLTIGMSFILVKNQMSVLFTLPSLGSCILIIVITEKNPGKKQHQRGH